MVTGGINEKTVGISAARCKLRKRSAMRGALGGSSTAVPQQCTLPVQPAEDFQNSAWPLPLQGKSTCDCALKALCLEIMEGTEAE